MLPRRVISVSGIEKVPNLDAHRGSPTGSTISSFPPFFGDRRAVDCPPLERIDFEALDGSTLRLHDTWGGTRGPIVMTPGTAMTALTYCVDSVPQNIVEFLVGQGFDIWLLDWRTSPLLKAHERPYTLDDVARYDWPAGLGPGALPFLADLHALACARLRPAREHPLLCRERFISGSLQSAG